MLVQRIRILPSPSMNSSRRATSLSPLFHTDRRAVCPWVMPIMPELRPAPLPLPADSIVTRPFCARALNEKPGNRATAMVSVIIKLRFFMVILLLLSRFDKIVATRVVIIVNRGEADEERTFIRFFEVQTSNVHQAEHCPQARTQCR